jgi:aminotransferase
MTQLCEERNGINLAQGFTDDPPPKPLRDRAVRSIRGGRNHYSPTWGIEELRSAVGEKLASFNRILVDPTSDVTITCGATEAIASSILALVDRGDEVILFEPFYENYVPNVYLADGVPIPVRLPEGDRFPQEKLKEAIGSRTKAIVLNTPQNPNGKVFRRDELRFLADVCVDYGLLAICDETYERFTYDGRVHVSLGSFPDMQDRTLTIGTFSKTFSASGWRVGYVAGPEDLSESVRRVHDYLTVAAPTPFQDALLGGFELSPRFYRSLVRSYERRRTILCDVLRECGFRFRIPEGAYYVLADFSALSGSSDTSFVLELLDRTGIAAVPGSAFYGGPRAPGRRVRFSFCKSEPVLRTCARRLRSFASTSGGFRELSPNGKKGKGG